MYTHKYTPGSPAHASYVYVQTQLLSSNDSELSKKAHFMQKVLEYSYTNLTPKQIREKLIFEFSYGYRRGFIPYEGFHYQTCFSATHPESYEKTMDRLYQECATHLQRQQQRANETFELLYRQPQLKYWSIYLTPEQHRQLYIFCGRSLVNISDLELELKKVGVSCSLKQYDLIGLYRLDNESELPGILIYVEYVSGCIVQTPFKEPNLLFPGRLKNMDLYTVGSLYKLPFINKIKLI